MPKITINLNGTPVNKLRVTSASGTAELYNSKPIDSTSVLSKNAVTTAWNGNPLPYSLATFTPGQLIYTDPNKGFDWMINQGDYSVRGTITDEQMADDYDTEIVLKYIAMIHGEEVPLDDPFPQPFPAPTHDAGDSTNTVRVTFGLSYESRQVKVTFELTLDDETTEWTGYNLFLNGTDLGKIVQSYIDYNSDVVWWALTNTASIRGKFSVVESDITITGMARTDFYEDAQEDTIAGVSLGISKTSGISFEDNAENTVVFDAAGDDTGFYGYNASGWKISTGNEGTTPGNSTVITTESCLQHPGISFNEYDPANYRWQITKGNLYAGGLYAPLGNTTQGTVNVKLRLYPCLGTYTDPRNGKVYRTALMPDGKLWTIENLDYDGTADFTGTIGTYYNNDASVGAIQGRLYTADEMIAGQNYVNMNPSGRFGRSPDGWHIPSDLEWIQLARAIDPTIDPLDTYASTSGTPGTHMKGVSAGGDNTSGFEGLFGGYQMDGVFGGLSSEVRYWSCSDTSGAAIYRTLDSSALLGRGTTDKNNMRAYIRFVKDWQ
jgi:uncharacterized protein (TIGR02145 family)